MASDKICLFRSCAGLVQSQMNYAVIGLLQPLPFIYHQSSSTTLTLRIPILSPTNQPIGTSCLPQTLFEESSPQHLAPPELLPHPFVQPSDHRLAQQYLFRRYQEDAIMKKISTRRKNSWPELDHYGLDVLHSAPQPAPPTPAIPSSKTHS